MSLKKVIKSPRFRYINHVKLNSKQTFESGVQLQKKLKKLFVEGDYVNERKKTKQKMKLYKMSEKE